MRNCVVILVALMVGSVARADDNTSQAEVLFNEGRTLLDAGKMTEACEKFEASLRLNSQAAGTLLNVANCDEKRGRIASAVAHYKVALDIGREREQKRIIEDAQKKLAALESLVPHVTITIAQRLPGMKLVIDDKAIGIDDKSIPVDGVGVREMPLDPGDHTIAVSAPGRLPFDYKFSIVQGESKTVAIPILSPPPKNTRKTIGLIIGGSGLAVAGAGGVVALIARSNYNNEFKTNPSDPTTPHCVKQTMGGPVCDHDGLLATSNARTIGNIATGIVIVGAAAVVVGGVVWFTAPSRSTETKIAITPEIGPDGVGFAASGRF